MKTVVLNRGNFATQEICGNVWKHFSSRAGFYKVKAMDTANPPIMDRTAPYNR